MQCLKYFILIIFLFSNVTAQPLREVISTDFLISEENVPSTFIQKNVRVFPNSNKGFIAAWEDNRNGTPGYYAQRFNEYYQPVGKNFPTSSNHMFEFLDNSYFLSIGDQILNYYFDNFIMYIEGTFHDSFGNKLVSKTLGYAILPWCGTGYLGVDYHCAANDDHYLFLLRDDGEISFAKYDSIGDKIYSQADFLEYPRRAVEASIAASSYGQYLIAWLEIDEYHKENGYFGTFFNSNDSVIADKIPLGFPVSAEFPFFWNKRKVMKTVCLNDTAYLVFVTTIDSGYLYYRKFDLYGNYLSDVQRIEIPNIGTEKNYIDNFSISNLKNDKFNIMLTVSGYRSNQRIFINYLLTFDTDGLPVGSILIDSIQNLNLGESFYKITDSTFYIGTDANGDAYLTKLLNFTPVESKKLNDDEIGSNEISPLVTKVDDNHFFVSWQDEVKYSGQLVDKLGNKVRNPVILKGKYCEFFPDWSFINSWRKNLLYGFTIYDKNWNVVKRETLETCHTLGNLKILSDSNFVIPYSKNGQDVWLSLYSKNGVEILQREVTSSDKIDGLTIFINDSNTFWIKFGNKVQLYSNLLEPLNNATVANVSLHLEGDRFLKVYYLYEGSKIQYYGTIISLTGDTIRNKFLLTTNPFELSYGKLTSKSFLVVYRLGNNIYAKAYTNEGIQEKDSVLIHQAIGRSRQHANFAFHNKNVFFVWSEARTLLRGYDIYGSVFGVSTFVDVKESENYNFPVQFKLEQNYPNPFNSSTTFIYDVPKSSFIKLNVYDILGREIAILVNEYKEPGRYKVKFSITETENLNISSGVYIYRMISDENIISRKMMLIR